MDKIELLCFRPVAYNVYGEGNILKLKVENVDDLESLKDALNGYQAGYIKVTLEKASSAAAG